MVLPSFISDLGRSFLKNDILSIDIGFTNIKVVHSRKKNGGSLKIINFGMGSTPNGCIKNGIISDLGGIAENLKKVIEERRISEKNVKIVISAGSNIISKVVYIPRAGEKRVEEKIRNEIMRQSLVNIYTQKLFYRVTGEAEREGAEYYKVLVTIVPNTTVENYIKLIKLLNFRPVSIEIPFSSVARFFSKGVTIEKSGWEYEGRSRSTGSGVSIVVDLGSETTNLSILNNGALEFNRVILAGGRSLDDIIGKKLGINGREAEYYKKMYGFMSGAYSNDEIQKTVDSCLKDYMSEIFNNIKRSMEFYVSRCDGQAAERIFLVGGGAGMKGIKEFVRNMMQKPVYTLENVSFTGIEFENHLDQSKIRYLVNAVGLAI